MDGAEVTAKHWDEYVAKHMSGATDHNRAEWMAHPVVQRYRREMSGADSEGEFLVSRYLEGTRVEHAVGIGAGHSVFELGLLGAGAVDFFDLYDLSPKSLELARESAERMGLADRIATHVADVNGIELGEGRFGLATFYSSLHHVIDLGDVVAKVARALRPDGMLFAVEYIGPNRFEYGEEELELARRFYGALDPRLRHDWPPAPPSWRARLRGRPLVPPPTPLPVPDPAQIAIEDPTEAVHSAEILDSLRSCFKRVDVTPMGGALALPTWPGLNHDYIFESPRGVRFVETLIDLDRALTESGRLPSYFALIAASDPLHP